MTEPEMVDAVIDILGAGDVRETVERMRADGVAAIKVCEALEHAIAVGRACREHAADCRDVLNEARHVARA